MTTELPFRIKVVVDADPPDLEAEQRLADELCAYLHEKYQFNVVRMENADIPEEEWRRK